MPSQIYNDQYLNTSVNGERILCWTELLWYICVVRKLNGLGSLQSHNAIFAHNGDRNCPGPSLERIMDSLNISPKHGIAFCVSSKAFDDFVCALAGGEAKVNELYTECKNEALRISQRPSSGIGSLPVFIYSMRDFTTMFNELATNPKLQLYELSYWTAAGNKIRNARVNI